ncbi:MAG: RNA polymerase sigma factor [Nannocystales bacterium]
MGTDFELWRAWRDGDQASGGTLVERHFASVYRFFATKVPDAADDLTQATFTACVETAERFRAESSFRSFLLGIARLQLLRFFEGRGQLMGGRAVSEVSMVDLMPSPFSAAACSEHRAMLIVAMRKLPLDLQIVLELHYWEDLETQEVADVLGVPLGTAKSRLSRARAQLRDVLGRPSSENSVASDLRATVER